MSLIRFDNVSFRYEEMKEDAISGVSLSIERGECIALLGENGSGKTTLTKHINGLVKPYEGTVCVDGMPTTKRTIAELAHTVGYVFQNPDHMIFADTVEEEVAFGPQNLGMDKETVTRRVDEILAFTRLDRYKETHPMSLSGGEKQRLAVASVIVSDPSILILDEPTTGLDYKSVIDMVDLIHRLRERGHTIILVTHDMSLVVQVAERVVLMKGGTILADGEVHEIFAQEDVLAQTYLEQPYAMKLSTLLGRGPCLTPEEFYSSYAGEEP
ncbi:ABC transporter ATP-binding protein [archaeon]|nr:MAG: ABC transporter ATP-binding protein [archaeon]